jgi:hypothetical protein
MLSAMLSAMLPPPPFRPCHRHRFWHCAALSGGLLFQCKNGSVVMDNPTHFVKAVSRRWTRPTRRWCSSTGWTMPSSP